MKVNLSAQEMRDLVEACEMGRDTLTYKLAPMTRKQLQQAMRLLELKERFEECIGEEEHDA